MGRPLLPWQEVAVIRAGELRPDGRLRFRIVVLLVARQNGKTEILAVLPAYWLAIDEVPMVLGMSTTVSYAQESWRKTRDLIQASTDPGLVEQRGARARDWTRKTNGQEELWLRNGGRYKIAASNDEGGRSLTVHRLMMDEARHTKYEAWEAAEGATDAVEDAQIWVTSNAGDAESELLIDLRKRALDSIGDPDTDICLLEWSAHEDADPADPEALLQANPATGHTGKSLDRLIRAAEAAKRTGGKALNTFKVNYLCQWVSIESVAIDAQGWRNCSDTADLAPDQRRSVFVLDVAPGETHATLMAGWPLADGRVRVRVVQTWDDTRTVVADVRKLVAELKPRKFGWLPTGPSAAYAANLADRRKAGRFGWPPPGVEVEEIRGELTATCMGFAAEVKAGRIAHPDDPLLNEQVGAAEPLKRGDGWVFSRKGDGNVDAVYAAAGAAFLARTLPSPVGRPRLIVPSSSAS